MRRVIDILLSTIGIIIFFPILMIVSIVLKFTGEGKVLYIQERIGLNGQKFGIFKFVTMVDDNKKIDGKYITTTNDSRILPFGKFLRKSKINELPQVFNILKGDMSVVGPRPTVQEHIDFYPQEHRDIILSMKPGLTGVASLFFRDEETMISNSKLSPKVFYKEYIAPYKAKLELWYKKNESFYLYIMIILFTAWSIFFPKSLLYRKFLKNLPKAPMELSLKPHK